MFENNGTCPKILCTKVSNKIVNKIVYANSTDLDQKEQSEQGLHSTMFAFLLCIFGNKCIKAKLRSKKYGTKCSKF